MKLINYQGTGATGLRIAAVVCAALGWLSLLAGVILAIAIEDGYIFAVWGLLSLAVMYLTAFSAQALASLAEAAQAYFNDLASRCPQGEEEE